MYMSIYICICIYTYVALLPDTACSRVHTHSVGYVSVLNSAFHHTTQ